MSISKAVDEKGKPIEPEYVFENFIFRYAFEPFSQGFSLTMIMIGCPTNSSVTYDLARRRHLSWSGNPNSHSEVVKDTAISKFPWITYNWSLGNISRASTLSFTFCLLDRPWHCCLFYLSSQPSLDSRVSPSHPIHSWYHFFFRISTYSITCISLGSLAEHTLS